VRAGPEDVVNGLLTLLALARRLTNSTPPDNTVPTLATDPSLALRYLELLDRMNDWFARTYWQNTAAFLAVSFGAPLVLFRETGLSDDYHRWFVAVGALLAVAVNLCLFFMLKRLVNQMDAIVAEKRRVEEFVPGVGGGTEWR